MKSKLERELLSAMKERANAMRRDLQLLQREMNRYDRKDKLDKQSQKDFRRTVDTFAYCYNKLMPELNWWGH